MDLVLREQRSPRKPKSHVVVCCHRVQMRRRSDFQASANF